MSVMTREPFIPMMTAVRARNDVRRVPTRPYLAQLTRVALVVFELSHSLGERAEPTPDGTTR